MTVESIALMMGGSKNLKRKVGTTAELVEITRLGLPSEMIAELADRLTMDRKTVARVVGITERTLSRRLGAKGRLSSAESDRAVRLARVMALAEETLGTMAKAAEWLKTANRALAGRPPFELLDTDAGVQAVETILGRIAYGVYS